MILDRTLAPPAQAIKKVKILQATKHILANGISLYAIEAGKQPVVRLELIFDAGSKYDTLVGASQFTAKMLMEGTSKHTTAEIAEAFDQYGAFLDISQSADRLNIMVHCLTRFLPKVLDILNEILHDSTLP